MWEPPTMPPTSRACYRRLAGFSLLELLVVIAVMAVMLSLLLPAVSGFSSTVGRRGAVNIVMNTLEQARVAALESGQNVYVGFADKDFPVEDMRYSAFIVFRESTEEEKNPPGKPAGSGPKYIVLKKWTRLPKGVAFKNVRGSVVDKDSATSLELFDGLNNEVGTSQRDQDQKLHAVGFNSSGAVTLPSTGDVKLYLYEGYFSGDQDNFTRNRNVQQSSAGLFEQISISRYTGRVQLDITATGA